LIPKLGLRYLGRPTQCITRCWQTGGNTGACPQSQDVGIDLLAGSVFYVSRYTPNPPRKTHRTWNGASEYKQL
jgi:hypothetical protein